LKYSVGAITDRPQILQSKICSPSGEQWLFPFGKSENRSDFRRAISDRPYDMECKKAPEIFRFPVLS
jgi:hypothetical protein